jgi:enamine deaminase RidA (YjgF/YER057c/UK114 family)
MSETAKPRPQWRYLPVKRHGDIVFVSGMTPRMNGKLLYVGKVASDGPAEAYHLAVELATQNAVQAALSELRCDERLASVLNLTVYVNAPIGYSRHSEIADFASFLLESVIGEGGIPSRVAVGVASLPGDAVVEVAIIAATEIKQC